MANPESINPRPHSQKVPFKPELGAVDELLGAEEDGSFTMGYGGEWQPISARDKKPIKKALWDNMEVPGSPYMGRDRGEASGGPWNAMAPPLSRNKSDQVDWEIVERVGTSEFPDGGENSNSEQRNGFEVLNEEPNEELQEQFGRLNLVSAKEKTMNFKKIAEKSKARLDKVYSIEDDYAAYGRYCAEPTCVGVWKELLGFDKKRTLKIERDSEVWKCPKCGKVTEAVGSISEQTSGPAAFNTYNSGEPAINADDFSPVNSIKPDTKRILR